MCMLAVLEVAALVIARKGEDEANDDLAVHC